MDGDVLGSKSILQSSKNTASDQALTCYILGTDVTPVADSLVRSSERLQATEQQQNIWRVQEWLESKNA